MAEFLFAVSPAQLPPGTSVGEPVMIEENNHVWGAGELNTSIFRIVKVALLPKDLARRVFFDKEGTPASESAALASALGAMRTAYLSLAAAQAEVPQDAAKIAAAQVAFDAAVTALAETKRRVGAYPGRRFFVDMTALGAGANKTVTAIRNASRRKGLVAFRDARLAGSTLGECLAAALAAATPVTDFDAAAVED